MPRTTGPHVSVRESADACVSGTCAPGRGRSKGLLAVFLCTHCTLTALAAGATFAFAAIPPVLGIQFEWVLPPFFFLGMFGIWLWWGRQAPVAERDVPVDEG